MPYSSTRGLVRASHYTPPDAILGGGARLANLADPIARPDSQWLKVQLERAGIECEFPGCEAIAVTMVTLTGKKFSPFVCQLHGQEALRYRHVSNELIAAMTDEILLTSYGSISGWRKVQLKESMPTFDRPQLGQI